MENITLLQNREYWPALRADISAARELRIETLTLSPVLVDLLGPVLLSGGTAEILTNQTGRVKYIKEKFYETRIRLVELGAIIHTWHAPYLHHQKIVLIAPDIIYLGSHNMSMGSMFSNIETSIRLVHQIFYDKLLTNFRLKTSGTRS